MDSRIEELANIIRERSTEKADLLMTDDKHKDKCHYYITLASLALNMIEVINEYRRRHPKEYEDPAKYLHEQIVSLRQEVRTYREREATMGWAEQ